MKSVSPLVFSASLKTIINIPTFIKSSSSIFNSLLGHPDPCERTKHFNKLSCHVRRMWAFCKQLVFKALPSILSPLIVFSPCQGQNAKVSLNVVNFPYLVPLGDRAGVIMRKRWWVKMIHCKLIGYQHALSSYPCLKYNVEFHGFLQRILFWKGINVFRFQNYKEEYYFSRNGSRKVSQKSTISLWSVDEALR